MIPASFERYNDAQVSDNPPRLVLLAGEHDDDKPAKREEPPDEDADADESDEDEEDLDDEEEEADEDAETAGK